MNCKKGFNVLVVDDCEDNLLLMELLLQSDGYRVTSANSGTKGLLEVSKQCPDLIILDLMMPDISGLEMVWHLKNKYRSSSIPIILLTANSNLNIKDVRGVDAVCHKPFDVNNFLNKIKSLIDVSKKNLIFQN
ncbi:MAG: response regulator [Pleurocapsa sp.]